MSDKKQLKESTEISSVKPEKEITEFSWSDPYEMTFYFFVPEQVFFDIAPILGSYDAFLKAKGQEVNIASSTIVKAAWALAGGSQPEVALAGGSVSITMGMIETMFENEYDQLIQIFEQARENCSEYKYPRSSWELIHESTWRYFPGRPCLVSSNWTFQGINDPCTD